MAVKKKAGRKTLPPFEFTVAIEGTKVAIVGKNDGNIRARKQPVVKFVAGPGVGKFKIDATEFQENDNPNRPPKAWPFKKAKPAGVVSRFSSRLVRPARGASLLIFKYTVAVPGFSPADPVIIIEQ